MCRANGPQEDFLNRTFGNVPKVQDAQFAILDAEPEVAEFEASGSDHDVSDAVDSDAVFSASDPSQFGASDEDDEPEPLKRSYAKRRAESQVFLGKEVCRRACARLLGIGQTTLDKLRKGEAIYRPSQAVPVSKHPSLGISMRGHSSEQCLVVTFDLF